MPSGVHSLSNAPSKLPRGYSSAPLFEELVIGATIKDLIDGEHLVDCDIYAPSEPNLKGIKSSKGIDGLIDFNQKELESLDAAIDGIPDEGASA